MRRQAGRTGAGSPPVALHLIVDDLALPWPGPGPCTTHCGDGLLHEPLLANAGVPADNNIEEGVGPGMLVLGVVIGGHMQL